MIEKKKLFNFCVLNFFPTNGTLKKIGIETHPIDLSCHQKFEKFHWPEAEILAHKIGNMEKVTVD